MTASGHHRRWTAMLAAAAAACAMLAPLPGEAAAQSGSRQSAELAFTESLAGTPSGLRLSIDYVNPDEESAKPPAVRTVIEELAAGAQIDTSVPDRCGASDVELMLLGAGACPPGSRVGAGTIRIDTGFPEPVRFVDADIAFLNNTNQLIFVSTERGTGARVVSRSTIEDGRRIVNNAPLLPGTPPDGGAIDVVEVGIDAISRQIGGVTRGYITTPGQCPRSRAWTNSITFTYADGVSQTVSTDSRCARGKGTRGR